MELVISGSKWISDSIHRPTAHHWDAWRYCTATVQWNCTLAALKRLGEGKLWYQTSAALRLHPFMWKARGVNPTQIEEWSPLGGIVLNLTQFRQLLHPDYLQSSRPYLATGYRYEWTTEWGWCCVNHPHLNPIHAQVMMSFLNWSDVIVIFEIEGLLLYLSVVSRGVMRSAASSYMQQCIMVADSRPTFVIVWEWHIGLALLCGCSGALEYPTKSIMCND